MTKKEYENAVSKLINRYEFAITLYWDIFKKDNEQETERVISLRNRVYGLAEALGMFYSRPELLEIENRIRNEYEGRN